MKTARDTQAKSYFPTLKRSRCFAACSRVAKTSLHSAHALLGGFDFDVNAFFERFDVGRDWVALIAMNF